MVYQPGTDNSEEIAVVRRSLESVLAEYDRSEYRYHGDQEDCQARKGRLSGRLRELSAVPVTEGGCKPSPTGRTCSLDWQAAWDVQRKRHLVISAGFSSGGHRVSAPSGDRFVTCGWCSRDRNLAGSPC
jgi:hypothetical protein